MSLSLGAEEAFGKKANTLSQLLRKLAVKEGTSSVWIKSKTKKLQLMLYIMIRCYALSHWDWERDKEVPSYPIFLTVPKVLLKTKEGWWGPHRSLCLLLKEQAGRLAWLEVPLSLPYPAHKGPLKCSGPVVSDPRSVSPLEPTQGWNCATSSRSRRVSSLGEQNLSRSGPLSSINRI